MHSELIEVSWFNSRSLLMQYHKKWVKSFTLYVLVSSVWINVIVVARTCGLSIIITCWISIVNRGISAIFFLSQFFLKVWFLGFILLWTFGICIVVTSYHAFILRYITVHFQPTHMIMNIDLQLCTVDPTFDSWINEIEVVSISVIVGVPLVIEHGRIPDFMLFHGQIDC